MKIYISVLILIDKFLFVIYCQTGMLVNTVIILGNEKKGTMI